MSEEHQQDRRDKESEEQPQALIRVTPTLSEHSQHTLRGLAELRQHHDRR